MSFKDAKLDYMLISEDGWCKSGLKLTIDAEDADVGDSQRVEELMRVSGSEACSACSPT